MPIYSSTRFYKEKQRKSSKRILESIKIFPKKEKKKGVTDIEVSQKTKTKAYIKAKERHIKQRI